MSTTNQNPDHGKDFTQKLTLKGGTFITVDGREARLAGDTEVECAPDSRKTLSTHTDAPFQEYPKMVEKDGVQKIVNNAEEEQAWLNPPPAPESHNEAVRQASSLDDVAVDMDRIDTRGDDDPPHKQSRGGKKK